MIRRSVLALALGLACLAAACACDDQPASTEPAAASATATAAANAPRTQPSATTAAASSAASAEEAPPESIAAQHVLIAYRGAKNAPKGVKRSKAAAKKLAEEVAAKARGGADFSALVQQYSEDPGTKDRLGSLGKFKREAMVKPFSDAAFALKVGEVSDPVETPFGFHVIKRNQ